VSILRTKVSVLISEMYQKFAYLNPGSDMQHIDELSSIFDGVGFHFMCVSKTWLKPRQTNKMMAISGYRLLRSDRTDGRRSGGVGLYVKTGICYKILGKSTSAHPVDFLFVDFWYTCTCCLHLLSKRIDGYPILEELADRYPRHIIMCDFNVGFCCFVEPCWAFPVLIFVGYQPWAHSFSICGWSHFNRSFRHEFFWGRRFFYTDRSTFLQNNAWFNLWLNEVSW
jgi:hypothetical protein